MAIQHDVITLESSVVINLQANSSDDSTLSLSWEAPFIPVIPDGVTLNYTLTITDLNTGTILREEITDLTNVTHVGLGMRHNISSRNDMYVCKLI